jgi:hypothetical protein
VNNSEGNGDNNFDRADCMAEQPGDFQERLQLNPSVLIGKITKTKNPLIFQGVLIFFLRSGRDSNPRPTA